MIRTRQLEVLCAVIDMGTTAGAADALSVSQPAVSNMIRHLEDTIGFPLFKRERGRLSPTPEALHIAQEAQHLFSQQKRVSTIIDQLKGGTLGRLSVIATPSIGYGLLPHLIAEFTKTRPRVELSVELGSVDEIVQKLVSGQADLGLSITYPRHPALTVRPLAKGEMVCACPADHELAQSSIVKIADLNHVRHISYNGATPLGQSIDSVFSRQGLERRFFCEVRHTSTALEMVACGVGVALVDNFAVMARERPEVAIRKTNPKLDITLHGVTPNLFPTSQTAMQFLSFARQAIEKTESLGEMTIT